MPQRRLIILLWLIAIAAASLPAALASCNYNDGVNQLLCSKGFVSGKSLTDLPSVKRFSGCAKMLLSKCTTFSGMGYNCHNPACEPEYGDGDISKLPPALYPTRRATQCLNGCSLYMPRAQLCTVCLTKAEEALRNVTDILWVISAVVAKQRSTIMQGPNPRGRRLMQAGWNPEWNKAVIRRSGAGQNKGQSQSTGRSAGTSTTAAAHELTAAEVRQAVTSMLTSLGEVTASWMDTMDANDAAVRASINSPVPQGDTFAKFGRVSHGLVMYRGAQPGDGMPLPVVDVSKNGFNLVDPVFTHAPASLGITFPAGKLRTYTERLLQRDEQNGLAVAQGMQLMDAAIERLRLVGFTVYDHYQIPKTTKNVYGLDPTTAPARTVGEVVAQFSNKLVDGVGASAARLTEALTDVVSAFGENIKEGKQGAFVAKPTAFLAWAVDYQQTMKCYYTCLAYVLDCLFEVSKPPDCHKECTAARSIEVLTGTRMEQIARFSRGC